MSEESDLGVIREPLTPRQRRVLELIGKGYTNHQIAQDLGITLDGAKWHVREILTKLGVDNREEAAAWYERRRTPVARLQHALRALVPPAAVLKIAGAAAGVVVVVGLAIAAAIAFAGDGNPTQAVDTAEPTTVAPGGSTPGPAADFGGVPVREWTITTPQPIPDGLALYIATGCYGCDGPTASLQRIVRMGEGSDSHVETDTIFTAPGEGNAYILSIEPLAGGGSIFATVCTRGYCGGVGEPTGDAQSTLYRSTNGGVTWLPLETYDGWVHIAGLSGDGVALVAIGRTPSDIHYFLYETGQAIPAVDGAWWEQHTIGRQFAWRTERGELVNADGASLFAPPAGWQASLAGPSTVDGTHFAVELEREPGDQGTDNTGLVENGELLRVFTGRSVVIGGWLSGTLAVGNIFVDPQEIPGVQSTAGLVGSLPALLDFESGTITPLEIDGPLFTSDTYAGRNYVLAASRGAWNKAAAGNECVRLRSEPSLDAPIVACYSDGVLLDFGGETAEADGNEWGRFTGPDGHEGWSDLEFVRD